MTKKTNPGAQRAPGRGAVALKAALAMIMTAPLVAFGCGGGSSTTESAAGVTTTHQLLG